MHLYALLGTNNDRGRDSLYIYDDTYGRISRISAEGMISPLTWNPPERCVICNLYYNYRASGENGGFCGDKILIVQN